MTTVMNFAPYILTAAVFLILLIVMRLQASSARKATLQLEERLNVLEQELANAEGVLREEIRKNGEEKDLKITQLHEDLRATLNSFRETTQKTLAESAAATRAQNTQIVEKVTALLRKALKKPEQQKKEAPVTPPPTPAPAPKNRSTGTSTIHDKAKRLARLIVSDIVLYNQAAVEEGIRSNNFFEIMDHDIREARNLYDSRIPEEIRKETTYLDDAFADLIARKKRELKIT